MEARGFILGGAVAHQLGCGFVPIRKKGKLPIRKVTIAYSLEYGIDEMEMHVDAVAPGERVLLVDDLIATGGTAEGAVKLLKQVGAEVVAACFVIDLPDLGGAQKIRDLGTPVQRCWNSPAIEATDRCGRGWRASCGGPWLRASSAWPGRLWRPTRRQSRSIPTLFDPAAPPAEARPHRGEDASASSPATISRRFTSPCRTARSPASTSTSPARSAPT